MAALPQPPTSTASEEIVMSDPGLRPLDPSTFTGSARVFLEFCLEESERRRDARQLFDEAEYLAAVRLVVERLENLEQEARS
jgi:hypothetical protein